jgi:hypothetical protein
VPYVVTKTWLCADDSKEVFIDMNIFKDMIAVIKTEKERRMALLNGEDPDFADDKWLFTDAPFLNELCLVVLVALRHQVERELVGFAARVTGEGKEISSQRYRENVSQLRPNNFVNWEIIKDRLDPESCTGYESMELLRFLANSYKHNQSMEPSQDLLKRLNLEVGVKYAPLPDSEALRKALATFISLDEYADFCDITDRFVEIVSCFLVDVQTRTTLSSVKWGPMSLKPSDMLR